ncbi:MAG: hypothetical protein ABIC04_08970 [Nanoarchaeota archaeon]
MSSSIIFLGTGTDPYVVGKGLRSAGGIIIKVNDNQFHLDPGPGSCGRAKEIGVNLRATTAILVSNTNLYKCNDINVVIDAMTYSGFDKKGVLISTKSLINGTEKEKPYLTNYHRDCLERFIVLQPGQRVGVNEVEIEALRTSNNPEHSIGFKFYTPNFTLSYSSTTKYSLQIVEQYKNSGIIIFDMADPGLEDNPGLNREDIIRIINKVNPRLVILTGFGNKMLKADPLYEAREIQKGTKVQVIAAQDGFVVNPVSYSAQEGQRTFGTFKKEGPIEELTKKNEVCVEKVSFFGKPKDLAKELVLENGKPDRIEEQTTITQITESKQSGNQQNNP